MSAVVPSPDLPDARPVLGQGWRIGLFDSGVGGLSVLRALLAQLPLAHWVYVADSGHAPYGEKDAAYITHRCHRIADFLRSRQVDAIVVACNTATAMAVNSLRSSCPDLPIVGVEPGVKPAVARSRNKRVGVLATPGTLASKRFQALVEAHGRGATVISQACPGLAKAIESGDLDGPDVQALVDQFCAPLREEGVDTVVLGCTHYPLVAPVIQAALGDGVEVIDTSAAVARRVSDVLAERPSDSQTPIQLRNSPCPPTTLHAGPSVELWTSGEVAHLAQVAHNWLSLTPPTHPLPV